LPPECFYVSENNPPQISTKVDMWSIGVILFEMLYASKPFGNNMSQNQLLQEQVILKSRQVNFPIKPLVPKEAQDFIRHCLSYYQDERYDIRQAFASGYMQKK
jgi:tousled-like kinase